MKKITGLFLILAAVVLITPGCKKDPDTENPVDNTYNVSLSRDALEYINFPVGKYFIYKIPGHIALDSVRVVSSGLDIVNLPKNVNTGFPEHNIERYRIRMNKYANSTGGTTMLITEWLWATTVPKALSPYANSTTADVRLEFSGTSAGETVFFGRHNIPGTETLTVEGVTYTNVIKTETDNGLPVTDPNYKKNTFYWAKGVGIVRRETVSFNGFVTT